MTDDKKGPLAKPVELSDEQMQQAAGGAVNTMRRSTKIDGVDGESTDDKHKGE